MADLVTVLDTAHTLHDPTHQVDDGRLVDVLDTPSRVDALLRGSVSAGATVIAPDEFPVAELAAAHDEDLLDFLATAWESWVAEGLTPPVVPDSFGPRSALRRPGPDASVKLAAAYYCRDTCTPLVEGTWAAARGAAASAMTAARVASAGEFAYALCRPPGHHAARADFSGFCYLNNAALAATSLRHHGRVAILDLDFHHGNGTQDIFWNDPDILYASIHATPDRHFPFFSGRADERGGPDAPGTVRNVPLPDGTDGTRYVAELARLTEYVGEFAPDAVVVSLGLDIAASDPVGTFGVSDADLATAGTLVAAFGGPTVVVQEGGYDVARLEYQVAAFLNGLIGG